MALRTDPSVQAFQHNARELAAQGNGLSTPQALAGAGADQAGAAALASGVYVLSGAAGTGVRLPADVPVGTTITVYPPTANAINVYPHVGGTIDAGAANAAVAMTAAKGMVFRRVSDTAWRTVRD